eukprot:55085-Pyramimonas_sp.AAC.1
MRRHACTETTLRGATRGGRAYWSRDPGSGPGRKKHPWNKKTLEQKRARETRAPRGRPPFSVKSKRRP